MIQTKLKGMGVALITPFKEDESVDYDALMRMVDYLLQNNADFLCVLGTTAETPTLTEEEKKTIKLSLKKIIMIEIIVILGIAVVAGICISIWTRPQISTSNITQNNNATSKIKTYELNKIGYYKNENILEEKYNNNLDLIYCKYNSGNEIKEDTYNYEYDNKGRTIKVSLNNNDSTLEIEYTGEEISKITTNYSLLKKEYQIMEDMDENKFISEYSTLNQQIGNESKGQITYDGKYLFFSENINNEKYN